MEDPQAKTNLRFYSEAHQGRTLAALLKKASLEDAMPSGDGLGSYRLRMKKKGGTMHFSVQFEKAVDQALEEASSDQPLEEVVSTTSEELGDEVMGQLLDQFNISVDLDVESAVQKLAETPTENFVVVEETTEITEPEDTVAGTKEVVLNLTEPVVIAEDLSDLVRDPVVGLVIPVLSEETPAEEIVITPKEGLLNYLGVPFGQTISADFRSLVVEPKEEELLNTIQNLSLLGFSECSISAGLNEDGKTCRGVEWNGQFVHRVLSQ
jgi:hypothetical protein